MTSREETGSRRTVIKGLAGAGVWLAMGAPEAQQPASDRPPIRRAIPSSGEQISVIGLGTYRAFDIGSDAAEREQLKPVLQEFVNAGGKLIDSSPMYGSAETVVGDISAELGLRKPLFLATKVWTSGKASGIRQMEESFSRMRTDVMDLMQIHNLMDWSTHTATLKDWKQRGRVRYIGITHYHEGAYDDLERLIKTRDYDFVQLNYSIAERDAERSVLPLAQQLGVAVIANRPFTQANLFSKVRGKQLPEWVEEFDCNSWAQFFLKYIVSHPAVTCAIPATSKLAHLKDNMRAGYGKLPDNRSRQKMAQLIDEL
jgi:diketogulonate reductase-like aldo/keto reductase